MVQLKNIITLSITALTLSACVHGNHNVIANRDTAYLSATNTPPLRIPPGLESSSIEASYPIPDRNYPESAKRVSLFPPDLTPKKS